MVPKIKRVDSSPDGNYYHVRFRPPSQFKKVRIPDWAANIANSISKGAQVKMGETEAGNWLIQSVVVRKKYHRKRDARRLAKKIVKKIEE